MTDQSWDYDCIVIGAGAAGLMAAITSATRKRRTLLLEKNSKPGAKILMSGGTRCNLTQNTDIQGIISAYGKPGKFLHSALAALTPSQLQQFFNERGVPTKCEPSGKVFPQSDRAQDVLAALQDSLQQSGAALKLKHAVTKIETTTTGFKVGTDSESFQSQHILITTGGLSFPGCGTTGDGYPWCEQLGHTIVNTRPALVPLVTPTDSWVTPLQGITLADLKLTIRQPDSTVGPSQRGSTLFTHFGISGPTAMNLSRVITASPSQDALLIEFDFFPDSTWEQTRQRLTQEFRNQPKKQARTILSQQLPQRLCEVILEQTQIDFHQKSGEISRQQIMNLATTLHQLPVAIVETLGFKKAEVTAGGVALHEINSSTMESKKQPGLFLAGEILDLDGPIGGYNFQAAFSTGYLAGQSI